MSVLKCSSFNNIIHSFFIAVTNTISFSSSSSFLMADGFVVGAVLFLPCHTLGTSLRE